MKTKIPRYLSPALHDAVIAFKDGGYCRWQCISKKTGKVLACSEWVPTFVGRHWINEMIDQVNKERGDLK